MIEYKQSVAKRVPVRIFDNAGNPVAGIAFGAVTASVQKADGSTAAVTVTISDWSETTFGAFSGTGSYELILPAGALDTTGQLIYAISTPGNRTHVGVIKVVANEEVDTYTLANTISGTVERIQVLKEGRWKIFDSGPDANRLVLYDFDGISILQKWDLKDKTGAPSSTEVYERVPVFPLP